MSALAAFAVCWSSWYLLSSEAGGENAFSVFWRLQNVKREWLNRQCHGVMNHG